MTLEAPTNHVARVIYSSDIPIKLIGAPLSKMRFYRKALPDVGDIVMARVVDVNDIGAHVSLPEYDDIMGLVIKSEFSRKRIQSVKQVMRKGKKEVCKVINVDKRKGNVDLSKKQVQPSEKQEHEHQYRLGKTVHDFAWQVSYRTGADMWQVLEDLIWPLYDQQSHAYHGLCQLATQESIDHCDEHTAELIREYFRPQLKKLRAKVHAYCVDVDGLDTIKGVMMGAQSDYGVEVVRGEDAMIYDVLYQDYDHEHGAQYLNGVADEIARRMCERTGGHGSVHRYVS